MNERFRDEGKTIYDFLFEFFIKCPQCGNFAIVKSFPNDKGSYLFYEKRSLICDGCGFIREYKFQQGPIGSDYPLWLESNCCGEKLWAYNLKHLIYLEQYIKANLRENYQDENGFKNNTMISRLPKWIKDGNNRDAILKCIEKMKKSIPPKYL